MDFGGEDQKSALEQYGVDLTARAKSGKLDPVIVSLIYLLVLQFYRSRMELGSASMSQELSGSPAPEMYIVSSS
jgi:hypothetical protein